MPTLFFLFPRLSALHVIQKKCAARKDSQACHKALHLVAHVQHHAHGPRSHTFIGSAPYVRDPQEQNRQSDEPEAAGQLRGHVEPTYTAQTLLCKFAIWFVDFYAHNAFVTAFPTHASKNSNCSKIRILSKSRTLFVRPFILYSFFLLSSRNNIRKTWKSKAAKR